MGQRLESLESVQKSTVRIKDKTGKTWGTGFFVSSDGHLLTCAHVVKDAGGWENVRILDQPVSCIYQGDAEREDFVILQVEDIPVVPAKLATDFDPGDEFLSFGFSNDDFYGAPIRGEITALARCSILGNQKLIRLETFSDAQRIEGGQSGAPIFVYKNNQYKAVGLIVAAEDMNGGLAIPFLTLATSNASFKKLLSKPSYIGNKRNLAWVASGIFIASAIIGSLLYFAPKIGSSVFACSDSKVAQLEENIDSELRANTPDAALFKLEQYLEDCPNNSKLLLAKSRLLIVKEDYTQTISLLSQLLNSRLNSEEVVIAKYNLGIALSESGDCSQALEHFLDIENDVRFKEKVYYNIGLCHEKLEDWNKAIRRFEYVLENGNYTEDTKGEKTEFSFYYDNSIKHLMFLYARLAYENQESNLALIYQKKFLESYDLFLANLARPDLQKESLDLVNRSIKNGFDTPEFAYIYSQLEVKKLICQWYKEIQSEIPSNLQDSCVS